MPYALLNPDGTIKDVVPKPSPAMKIGEGERLVKYNPPKIDPEMEAATPVEPVDPAATTVEFAKSKRPAELAWAVVRRRRDERLRESDFTQLSDVPLTGPQRQQWVQYRQALRDVTNQPDPHAIVWPTPPSSQS